MGRRLIGFAEGALFGYLTAGAGNVLLPTLLGGASGLMAASQHIDGPRLNDMGVTVSEEGQPLPKVFGTVRLGCSLIWSAGLHDHTQDTSGGGGSGMGGAQTETITYTTSCYFIGGVGTITAVHRLWMNQTLFFDLSPVDPTNPPGNIFVEYDAGTHTWNPPSVPNSRQSVYLTIFGGGDTQLPWDIMEAIKGVGKTPAYTHRWGFGLHNYDAGQFGNGPGNATVEVEGDENRVTEILYWLGGAVGLARTDFDLHELDGVTIDGFIIGSRASAGTYVQQLMNRYNFTLPEVDGVLRARRKGNASMASLSMADIEIRLPGQAAAPTRRPQADELQIPQVSEAQYYDLDRKYHPGYRYGRRQNTISRRKESFSYSMAMHGSAAERIAKIRAHENETRARSYALQLGVPALARAAGDDITIPTPVGARLVHVTDIDAQLFGIVKANAYAYNPLLYTAPIPLDTVGLDVPTAGNVSNHSFVIVETNAVRDEINAYLGVYVGFTVPYGQTYTLAALQVPQALLLGTGSGGLFTGTTNLNFPNIATLGTVEGVIPDNPDAYSYYWDDTTTITVRLKGGRDLANASDTDLYNGANGMIMGRELIQFKNATLLEVTSDNQKRWQLDTLLRGRRGTEYWMSQHADGEPCMLVDNGCQFVPLQFSALRLAINATVWADNYSQPASFEAQGYTLFPYSPDAIAGTRDGSGNLTVEFVNRSRYSDNFWITGGINEFGETTPNATYPDKYKMEILSGAGAVLNTYLGNDLSFTVSAADQVAYYGSLQSSIAVRLYESSAIVGWGYPSPIKDV